MKNLALTIACCFYFFNSSSQSSFEYLRSNPVDEITYSIIDDSINNIYFPIVNFQNALIMKLDFNGTILDSVKIINHSGTCNLSELIRINNEQFLALGEWKENNIYQLWFVKFNNNLEILLDSMLNSNGWHINDFKSIINHKGNIVFIAQYSSIESSLNCCMYEISLDGNVIRKKFFDYTGFNIGYTLLEDYSEFSYKIFSLKPLESRSLSILSILDTNFNITDTRSLYGYIDGHNSAKWLSYSTYLLTGERYLDSSEEMDIGILKLNQNDSVLSSLYIGKLDTVDTPGQKNSLDFISSNNIFFCGTTNSYSWPFQNDPSWIMVNIIDSDLCIKNQQFYGGDAFYLVNTVLTTQDSGCIMACSRYDYLTQFNEFDVYILKVNKDGLLVSVPDEPTINQSVCILYPNPGKDFLYIESLKDNINIEFFDINGKLMLISLIESGENSIPVSNLPPGIYLYRILDQRNLLIQSGKWIKF